MNFKDELLSRVYLVFVVVCLAAVLVLGRLGQISIFQRNHWVEQGKKSLFKTMPVDAERGNVLSESGSILATSMPYFELRMDAACPNLEEKFFNENIDSLAYFLCRDVDRRISKESWKNKILTARNNHERFLLLKDEVSFDTYEKVKNFPIFREGRNKGGLLGISKSKRTLPYGDLAKRTIGYIRPDIQGVGIEGAFNNILRGEQGERLMERVQGSFWIPSEETSRVLPVNGSDLVVTLDESIQDIANSELHDAMVHHNAEFGCAIVMEVKTGKIRALVNLDKDAGSFVENFNYAIAGSVEPGSTFKAATMLSLFEDGFVKNIEDTVKLNKGRIKIKDRVLEDAHLHDIDSTSIRKAFAMSSNVGIANLVMKYYGENDQAGKFVDNLKKFGLNEISGIDIPGEVKPTIKEAYSDKDYWSGTTLPWMSIGYELAVTPLQLLTFYNAIANDGKMMKPYLVSEVRKHNSDVVLQSIEPQALKKRIASKKSIGMMKTLLEAVVDEGGTAANLKTNKYRFAGKTGTSQVTYQKIKAGKYSGGHRSSFVGFFPVEDPMYSIIVVISEPQQNGYYGAFVAGPVFRGIADRVFSRMYDQHYAFNEEPSKNEKLGTPQLVKAGYQPDIRYILNELNIPFHQEVKSDWSQVKRDKERILLADKKLEKSKLPNVIGMGARDAVYLMENLGVKVETVGCGKVRRQSISPGTVVRKEISVRLFLG